MNWLGKKRRIKKRIKKWFGNKLKEQRELEKLKEKARREAFNNSWTFANALEAKGYERIGSGAFSTVFALPKDDSKVIKIQHNPEKDGWINYIKWAHDADYTGKLAPKVYSYKFIKSKKPIRSRKGGEEGFGISLMERLDKTVREMPEEHESKVITPVFDIVIRNDKNKLAHKILNDVDPELEKFARNLRFRFGKNLDLHGGNFMCRKDGSLVLIDPIAGVRSMHYKENRKFH